MKIKMANKLPVGASPLVIAKLLISAVLVAALLTGCGKKDKKAATEEVETIFAVNAMKAIPSTLDNYLQFGGNVQVASSVDIYPDAASGKITKMYVKVGDFVKKNDVVAEVNSSKPGMDYRNSPVKAPVSGTITSFPLNVGTTVSAQTSIGKIGSTGRLEIKTFIAERFVSRVSLRQKAELTFDAYPGVIFPAVLVEVDPVLDSTSRTLGVKLVQEPVDERLKAGMYARIKLITDTKDNTIVVPANVVVNKSGENVVFVVNTQTNTVKASIVKLGIKVDDRQEVEQGIAPGDLVVTKGQTLLTDGAKVKVASIEGE